MNDPVRIPVLSNCNIEAVGVRPRLIMV